MSRILTFKMWEDAAANSAGGGGVHGIGVGAKGEPGVYLKKKKKKTERVTHNTKPGADWEKRSQMQRDTRTQMWKALGNKLKRK